ncbi:MAG TPA: MmcQ/YjbR family DNA-binding protein [Ruminiclostridium sp.]|nr:MmcQ/YjbR family DNA-binding protein [Ruminiclostridium sp.]
MTETGVSETKQEDLVRYCLTHKKAYLDYPFGEEPVCAKVEGKIFADIYLREDNYKITLKGEPMAVDFYRQSFPGAVGKGYHCPAVMQPYWYTVYLNKAVSDEEVFHMIDESYGQVIKTFSQKKQAEIQREE